MRSDWLGFLVCANVHVDAKHRPSSDQPVEWVRAALMKSIFSQSIWTAMNEHKNQFRYWFSPVYRPKHTASSALVSIIPKNTHMHEANETTTHSSIRSGREREKWWKLIENRTMAVERMAIGASTHTHTLQIIFIYYFSHNVIYGERERKRAFKISFFLPSPSALQQGFNMHTRSRAEAGIHDIALACERAREKRTITKVNEWKEMKRKTRKLIDIRSFSLAPRRAHSFARSFLIYCLISHSQHPTPPARPKSGGWGRTKKREDSGISIYTERSTAWAGRRRRRKLTIAIINHKERNPLSYRNDTRNWLPLKNRSMTTAVVVLLVVVVGRELCLNHK
jgi:hypothetical protein